MLNYKVLEGFPLGTRFTVLDNELVESPTGEFETSFTLREGVVYLNKFEKKASIIPQEGVGIGRSYKVMRNDCVLLCSRYLDSINGSKLEAKLLGLTRREYLEGYTHGYQVSKIVDWGFETVDEPSTNSLVSYQDSEEALGTVHLCVFVENNLLMRHHRGELSTYCNVSFLNEKFNVGYYNYGN